MGWSVRRPITISYDLAAIVNALSLRNRSAQCANVGHRAISIQKSLGKRWDKCGTHGANVSDSLPGIIEIHGGTSGRQAARPDKRAKAVHYTITVEEGSTSITPRNRTSS